MNYLYSIYDKLFELIESYSYELLSNEDPIVKYKFYDSDKNEYLVEIKNLDDSERKGNTVGKRYEIVYFVLNEGQYSVSKIVNVNPYRTIRTVLGDILIDFLKKRPWVSQIKLTGLSKDIEKEYISQRTKFYLRYLERNPIKGFRVRSSGNLIILDKYN
jgi:hypothetical protein